MGSNLSLSNNCENENSIKTKYIQNFNDQTSKPSSSFVNDGGKNFETIYPGSQNF
jgi:hypothetical protein